MHRTTRFAYAALALPFMSTAGLADLSIRFIEGAPKDRFEIKNVGACTLPVSSITLDLSTSHGGLIFDVTGRGAGVKVFQPFEVVAGEDVFSTLPTVVDGQNKLDLPISELDAGASIAFTIDVDDTLGKREITVSGSEIAGATVTLVDSASETTATFDAEAKARILGLSC